MASASADIVGILPVIFSYSSIESYIISLEKLGNISFVCSTNAVSDKISVEEEVEEAVAMEEQRQDETIYHCHHQ